MRDIVPHTDPNLPLFIGISLSDYYHNKRHLYNSLALSTVFDNALVLTGMSIDEVTHNNTFNFLNEKVVFDPNKILCEGQALTKKTLNRFILSKNKNPYANLNHYHNDGVPIIFYISGHGNGKYLSLRDHELWNLKAIDTVAQNSPVIVFLETCKARNHINYMKYASMVVSSDYNEESKAIGVDDDAYYMTDEWSHKLYEYMKQIKLNFMNITEFVGNLDGFSNLKHHYIHTPYESI